MTQRIDAAEMTRRIRDKNYERLRGLSRAKRLAFYREQAKRMNLKAARLAKKKQARIVESQKL